MATRRPRRSWRRSGHHCLYDRSRSRKQRSITTSSVLRSSLYDHEPFVAPDDRGLSHAKTKRSACNKLRQPALAQALFWIHARLFHNTLLFSRHGMHQSRRTVNFLTGLFTSRFRRAFLLRRCWIIVLAASSSQSGSARSPINSIVLNNFAALGLGLPKLPHSSPAPSSAMRWFRFARRKVITCRVGIAIPRKRAKTSRFSGGFFGLPFPA